VDGEMRRAHEWATTVWCVLAGGAALGFAARDLLGLPRPAVALAWIGGALAVGLERRRAHV
jgi:hypothetical protein